jgi:hypothetical protein
VKCRLKWLQWLQSISVGFIRRDGRAKKVQDEIRDTMERERNGDRPIRRIMGKSSKGNRIVYS